MELAAPWVPKTWNNTAAKINKLDNLIYVFNFKNFALKIKFSFSGMKKKTEKVQAGEANKEHDAFVWCVLSLKVIKFS